MLKIFLKLLNIKNTMTKGNTSGVTQPINKKDEIVYIPIIDDKLYTVDETANILRISKNTVYTWKHQKKLKPNKSGGKLLFLGKELKRFMCA